MKCNHTEMEAIFQHAMRVSDYKRHMEETFGKVMPTPCPNPFNSMRILNKFTTVMCVQCKSLVLWFTNIMAHSYLSYCFPAGTFRAVPI